MAKKKKNVCDFLEPLEDHLIVTEPEAVGNGDKDLQMTAGGVILLKEAESLRATFGVVCKVLKSHKDLAKKFPTGQGLLIHEHGGHPVYSDTTSTGAWIITEGDIMAKVIPAYWKQYASASSR